MNVALVRMVALLVCLLPALLEAQAPAPHAAADDSAFIRTPPAGPVPRINGPTIYGARPGHPFFYHVPVTGTRPIMITASGLPEGLMIDPATGNITGRTKQAGTSTVTLTAINAAGHDSAKLRIVIGAQICLTPPLGWNSWNCFHGNIDETKIRAAADAMVATGLIDHGWTYINMDDKWEGERDANGEIQSSKSFPDMKALADYVHSKGLKIGLYSSPGPTTCAGAVASYQHEDQDAATYAKWGMDYLKYDWCSYGGIANMRRAELYAPLLSPDKAAELGRLGALTAVLEMRHYRHDPAAMPQTDAIKQAMADTATLTPDEITAKLKDAHAAASALCAEARKSAPDKVAALDIQIDQEPYAKMRASLDKVDRDIVFSFCQYGMGDVWKWGADIGGNTWRTTGDIQADWKSVESHGFSQNGHEPYAAPGHWNDPDMLEVGNGKLTPDENYTHMTLWCMLASPLLIGTDMPKMSAFTVSLFSNDEVLAVNQDALGKQGYRVTQNGTTEVWVKPLEDGSTAVALFNRGETPADVSVAWADLKLTGKQTVRDLWRQKDLGAFDTGYKINVAPHGAELVRVKGS
jgi:alpha-galactosidase